MTIKRLLAALTLSGIACLSQSLAEDTMNYQGYLTDASGNALADGQYTLTFDLYTAAAGGSKVWGPFVLGGGASEGPKASLAGGTFNVVLGPKDSTNRDLFEAFNVPGRYLQITVGMSAPISPRQQVLAAPRAMHAKRADHATSATAVGNPGEGTVLYIGNSKNIGVNRQWAEHALNVSAREGDHTIFSASNESDSILFAVEDDGQVNIKGPDNDGAIAALKIETVGLAQSMLLDGNEITSNGTLYINNNGDNDVRFGDPNGHTSLGINTEPISDTTLKIQAASNHDWAFITEKSGSPLLRVSSKGGIDLHSTDYVNSTLNNESPSLYQSFIKMNAKSQNGSNTTVWRIGVDSNDVDDEDLRFVQDGTLRGWLDTGGVGWSNPSDRRLKKSIKPLTTPLASAMQLKPSTYLWKGQNPEGPESIGFIAQEVAEVLPQAVNESGGTLGLSYGVFGVVAIGAIQELKEEKDREIGALQAENASLKERLAAMEKQFTTLSASVEALQSASEKSLAKN